MYEFSQASNWSADRLISSDKRFSWSLAKSASADEPVYFFGEMVSGLSLDFSGSYL